MYEFDSALINNSWGFELDLPNTKKLKKTPHYIGGRYPCRSVAYIPFNILNHFSNETNTKDFVVIDPFMGSGTTAIEANKFTSNIYGIEVDPYARLIATTSTTRYSHHEAQEIKKKLDQIVLSWNNIIPNNDLQPSLKNIDYWFDEISYLNLLKLKTIILDLVGDEVKSRNLMMVAFADIIRACSLAERQSLKPYISKKFKKEPKDVLPTYVKILNNYIISVESSSSNCSNGISWAGSDATCFTTDSEVDIAITSPPYINALDYTRCIKIESSWLGTLDDEILVEIRNSQVGESSRVKRVVVDESVENLVRPYIDGIEIEDPRRAKVIMSYFQDMSSNLKSMYKALSNSAEYHLIIGNSNIRNIYVPTHEIIAKIAEFHGYKWVKYFKYPIKDHRTSIPRNGNGGKIDFEHVITLKKNIF